MSPYKSSSHKPQIMGVIKSKSPSPPANNPSKNSDTKDSSPNQSAATTPQPLDSPQSPATQSSSTTSNPPSRSPSSPSTPEPSAQPEPKGLRRSLEYNNQKRKRLGISKLEDLQSSRDISACLAGFNLSLGAWTYVYLASNFLGLLSPMLFLGLTVIFSKQAAEFQHITQVMKRKQAAEKQIAQLLEDHLAPSGAEIRSLLHQNQLEIEAPQSYIADYLDILLTLPNGKQFAIYVLALKGEKDTVFYDFKAQELRYRHGHGKKRWSISPIAELKRKVNWLSEHTSLISKPITMILAFPNPIRVKAFDDSAVCVGQLKVTQVEDVYVVGEKELIELINQV